MSDTPTTGGDLAATAPTEPSAPPDINPDVVAQTSGDDPAQSDTEASAPTLDDRVAALEVRVFGYSNAPAEPDADTDDEAASAG